MTKTEHLRWLNKADVFIEDNETNVEKTDKLGIRSFIVSRPWNSSTTKMNEILQELSGLVNADGICSIGDGKKQSD